MENFAGEFSERYSVELDEDAVAELLSGDEIATDCLRRLAPECDAAAVAPALAAMGFRVSG